MVNGTTVRYIMGLVIFIYIHVLHLFHKTFTRLSFTNKLYEFILLFAEITSHQYSICTCSFCWSLYLTHNHLSCTVLTSTLKEFQVAVVHSHTKSVSMPCVCFHASDTHVMSCKFLCNQWLPNATIKLWIEQRWSETD